MTAETDTTPLPELVRAFLDRTRIAQEKLAREAGVTTKTVWKVYHATRDQRFDPNKTEVPIREAINRLLELEKMGGWETALKVETLAADVAELRETGRRDREETMGAIRDIQSQIEELARTVTQDR